MAGAPPQEETALVTLVECDPDVTMSTPVQRVSPTLRLKLARGSIGLKRIAKLDKENLVQQLVVKVSELERELSKVNKRCVELSKQNESALREGAVIKSKFDELTKQNALVMYEGALLKDAEEKRTALLALRETVRVWSGLTSAKKHLSEWTQELSHSYDQVPAWLKNELQVGWGVKGVYLINDVKNTLKMLKDEDPSVTGAQLVDQALRFGAEIMSMIENTSASTAIETKLRQHHNKKERRAFDEAKDTAKAGIDSLSDHSSFYKGYALKLCMAKNATKETKTVDGRELILLLQLMLEANDVAHLDLTKEVLNVLHKQAESLLPDTSQVTLNTMLQEIGKEKEKEEEGVQVTGSGSNSAHNDRSSGGGKFKHAEAGGRSKNKETDIQGASGRSGKGKM